MLLGGLWHGAGWNFVFWGALHGFYLIVAHSWHAARRYLGVPVEALPRTMRFVSSWSLTFASVIVGWVFFRAADMFTAVSILRTMSGTNGVPIPHALASGLLSPLLDTGVFRSGGLFPSGLIDPLVVVPSLVACLVVVCVFPNTQELVARYRPTLWRLPRNTRMWRPSPSWAILLGIAFAVSFALVGGESPFLYFQF
jgi:hypothetical protein